VIADGITAMEGKARCKEPHVTLGK
jgi:hypothetical protein